MADCIFTFLSVDKLLRLYNFLPLDYILQHPIDLLTSLHCPIVDFSVISDSRSLLSLLKLTENWDKAETLTSQAPNDRSFLLTKRYSFGHSWYICEWQGQHSKIQITMSCNWNGNKRRIHLFKIRSVIKMTSFVV